MSIYPQAAAGQGLYDTSDVPKAKLGTEMSFQTDQGVVYARYMQNLNGTSTIAAGFGVGFQGSGYGFDTAKLNNASAELMFFAGIAVTSHAASAYGWVVYKGPVTNIQLAATLASSAAQRTLALDSLGRYATLASTVAQTDAGTILKAHAVLRATTTTVTSALQSGAIVDIYWK
jgi:hypothetical protein